MAGAIEQQIRAEIVRDVFRDGVDPIDHRLHDAVGKPRQRHGQGIDALALRIPFHGDRFRDRGVRDNDRAAGRRTDRFAVERDGKTAVHFGDAGHDVKSLAPWHAGRAPHRLLGIERRLAGDFVE